MKLILIFVVLCFVLSSLFTVVHGDPQDELNVCRRTCRDSFIPYVRRFADAGASRDELEDTIKNKWPACQKICYRCALNDAIDVMGTLKEYFYHSSPPPYSQKLINSTNNTLIRVTNSCFSQWEDANNRGDTTSLFP